MTTIATGLRHTQEVAFQSTGQLLTCWPEVDGVLVDPSASPSPTLSIYRNGSNTVIISGSVAEATNHQLSYSLDASDITLFPLSLTWGYLAEWSFTYSSVRYTIRRGFDVVRVPLIRFPPCRVDDLKRAHKMLEQSIEKMSLSDSKVADNFITTAWEDVLAWIESFGKRPSLITRPEAFNQVLKYRALQKACEWFRSAPNDLWSKMADEYKALYEEAQALITIQYDPSDNRGAFEDRGFAQPHLLTGPDRDVRGGTLLNWVPLGGRFR